MREVKETALRYQLLQACLPAALLALEDVNNNQDILTNYHINLAAKDDEVRDLSVSHYQSSLLLSQCDSGLGAYRLYELIYEEKDQKVGYFCSSF